MPSLPTIITLLSHYGYILLFPIAIIEGPIVTVIAAFLASQGYMNLLGIYAVVIAADIAGDFLFYALGRWNMPFIKKHGHYLGVTEQKIKKAEEYYLKHHHKSIIISKTIHGLGVVGLVAAGALKVPYPRFFRIALAVSLVQSAIFVLIGFFLGHAYSTIGKYLGYFATVTTCIIIAGIIGFLIYRFIKKDE